MVLLFQLLRLSKSNRLLKELKVIKVQDLRIAGQIELHDLDYLE